MQWVCISLVIIHIISSHHFLVIWDIKLDISRVDRLRHSKLNYAMTRDPRIAQKNAREVGKNKPCEEFFQQDDHMELANQIVTDTMLRSATKILPQMLFEAKRPWITTCTLNVIEQRHKARQAGIRSKEIELNSIIKQMVKKDREIYLKSLAASGDWHKLRQLRKPKKPSQGRLMDMKGQLVSSEHRAQTMT